MLKFCINSVISIKQYVHYNIIDVVEAIRTPKMANLFLYEISFTVCSSTPGTNTFPSIMCKFNFHVINYVYLSNCQKIIRINFKKMIRVKRQNIFYFILFINMRQERKFLIERFITNILIDMWRKSIHSVYEITTRVININFFAGEKYC